LTRTWSNVRMMKLLIFEKKKMGVFLTLFLFLWFKLVCENVQTTFVYKFANNEKICKVACDRGLLFSERVSSNMNLWIGAGSYIPIMFHPCQVKYSLIDFNDMSKYTLTKLYSCHIYNNSHVITTTWICHVDIWQ